jgi:hypothetical protein
MNYLLTASSPNASNWSVATNFVYTAPFPGRVTVSDLIKTNAPKFYRVRVGSAE